METTGEKDEVLGDYAVLLRALLPDVLGVHCYGHDGASVWSEEPNPPLRLTSRYTAALKALLADPAVRSSRVALEGAAAYLVPLRNEKDQPLGSLAILVGATGSKLTAEACAAVVLPVTRILQRELSLRVRLLEGYRKLSVQAAEERLLHEVERTVQGDPDCNAMLSRILSLCRHYLQVQSAAVLIPDKKIALLQGDRLSRAELEMLLESDSAGEPSAPADRYVVRINGSDHLPIGVLALAGWSGLEFSPRRRSRVGRYIATHIEAVLERAYDGLTGLMAWTAFQKLLAATLGTGGSGQPALLYCNIDRLHVANDTLGRDTGDKVLASFAAILREELAGHAITRIASDSFAALLMDTDLKTARQRGEAIASRFQLLEFGHGDRSYRASVSIGISTITDEAPAGDAHAEGGALATAQVACAAAKDRGRGRVEVYQPADLSIVQRFDDIQLVGYIRNAISRGRMVLLGQPIVSVKAGVAASEPNAHLYFEVLVRLLDDDDRQVSPAEFLSAAERYQLMEELDRWVVANTLELIGRSVASLKGSGARFAINLSGQSLGSEEFLGFVQQQLATSGVPPEMLCFEITETVAVANLQRAQTFMHTLRRTGCHFSLDDFGTGLSSFAYLKLFPVDTLKIDGSFIRDLPTNVISQSVVAAISEVARVMQLETVAEFVQDDATLALLRKLGITWAQGYLLGKPEALSDRLGTLVDAHANSASPAQRTKS